MKYQKQRFNEELQNLPDIESARLLEKQLGQVNRYRNNVSFPTIGGSTTISPPDTMHLSTKPTTNYDQQRNSVPLRGRDQALQPSVSIASLASSVQRVPDTAVKNYQLIDRSDLKQVNKQLDAVSIRVNKRNNIASQISLQKSAQRKKQIERAGLILNQNLVANLQPSMSAMQTLIAKEQVKT